MQTTRQEIKDLFDQAKTINEFEFVLALINYRGMGRIEETTNLYEWFEAIEFYRSLYESHEGKNKTRIGCLIYSTFFESSDFYNVLGSLCRIILGYRGSSYLYFKTKNFERFWGTSQKIGMISELLEDSTKYRILNFFNENHFFEIRNTFFHSAYSLVKGEYILFDSEPIVINGIGQVNFNIEQFLYPKIQNVLDFFCEFKTCFLSNFKSYTSNKSVNGNFPNPIVATIIGSKDGLRGFKITNSVNIYGKPCDSGIFYNEKYSMWTGLNITFNFPQKETIEVDESLSRYENKDDVSRNQTEFWNLMDKVVERNIQVELDRAVNLLIKYGNVRFNKMDAETNQRKKESIKQFIIPFYKNATEINTIIDLTETKKRLKKLE